MVPALGNGQSMGGDLIGLCCGRNLSAQLPVLLAKFRGEAARAASDMGGEELYEWLDDWRRWPQLKAVKGNHLYFIPPQLLQRHTLRILDGAERMCAMVERAR